MTTSFFVHNSGNTSAMRPIFFFEIFQILCRFKIKRKKLIKKIHFLRWLHFNALANNPKVSDVTKRDVSQVNLSDIEQKRGKSVAVRM